MKKAQSRRRQMARQYQAQKRRQRAEATTSPRLETIGGLDD
jgi:hypothetical protein